MKTKLLEALSAKCKSYGLTKKALEELTDLGVTDLTDKSTDEDIAAKADLLVPYAKAMQGEITRKMRRVNKPSTDKPSNDEGNGEGNTQDAQKDVPEWFAPFKAEMDSLKAENAKLKTEREAAERTSAIAEKAKKLGIPEFMAKRLNISAEADIDAELTSFKQELVSSSLMPREQRHEVGFDEAKAKADAEAWASSLPDYK